MPVTVRLCWQGAGDRNGHRALQEDCLSEASPAEVQGSRFPRDLTLL